MTREDTREPPGGSRGLLLVGFVVLTILLGGGAALWSLLREVSFDGAPGTPAASLGPGSASQPAPNGTALPEPRLSAAPGPS